MCGLVLIQTSNNSSPLCLWGNLGEAIKTALRFPLSGAQLETNLWDTSSYTQNQNYTWWKEDKINFATANISQSCISCVPLCSGFMIQHTHYRDTDMGLYQHRSQSQQQEPEYIVDRRQVQHSTGPHSTVPLSTGPLLTGCLSTSPLSTGPISTGPRSTGPLSPLSR